MLFVCLGNICRSPTAEGVMRHLLATEAPGLAIEVDSAGVGDYHVGEPPDARSQRAAMRRGIDLSGLRARQVSRADFMRFDLLLAMDHSNLRALRALKPEASRAEVRLFLEFTDLAQREVPDPYLGGPEDFERVLDLATMGARALIARLRPADQTGGLL